MKRSGIDRPGAAGVIWGQSPRKSALSSPRPRLVEATAVRALAIATTTTVAITAFAIGTLAIAIFANSPEKGLLPQRRVRFTAAEEGEFVSG